MSFYFQEPHKVLTDASMATSLTSSVTVKPSMSGVCYSVVFTGTPTGAFTVEGSDDYSLNADGSVKFAGTWNTLPVTPAVTASGSAGNGMLEIVSICYATRLVYTRTSGTGVLNVTVSGQGL